MRISFFCSPSRAENSFRAFICALSLLLSLICTVRAVSALASSDKVKEELAKDAFCAVLAESGNACRYGEFYNDFAE